MTNPRIETLLLGSSKTFDYTDGKAWTAIEAGSTPGRYGWQNIFRDCVGPTQHAKSNLDETSKSAWQLMFFFVLECTMEKTQPELQDENC